MTRFSFSLWEVFVGLKGTGLEMDWIGLGLDWDWIGLDWTGLIRWIPRWGKQQDRIGQDTIGNRQ